MDLQKIKVTDKKREVFLNMNIDSIETLLTHYPFRYEFNEMKPFIKWQIDDNVCFEAIIVSAPRVNRYAYKKSVTYLKVMYDEEEIELVMFNRPWTKGLLVGKTISVFGKYQKDHKVVVTNYNTNPIASQLGINPIYHVKEGMRQADIKKYMQRALDIVEVNDFIPSFYRDKYHLISENEAFNQIHFPKSKEDLKQAIRTLKYLEILRFQLIMNYENHLDIKSKQPKNIDLKQVNHLIDSLPFKLTDGQQSTIDEILKDLNSDKLMYRLVQGDVGCGKTLVALVALFANSCANYQSALMAPTEILAKQHYETIKDLLKGYDLNIALLCSSLDKKQKTKVLEGLSNGDVDIVIGTHALIQEQVSFKKLGLVVADEQHRFGVEQRKALLNKGEEVDFLLMSATPIPRTLAVSMFSDMSLSIIKDLPKGRQKIKTKVITENSLRSIQTKMLETISQGIKVYIVCPSIEKSDNFKVRDVLSIYENLSKAFVGKCKVGLLHGKMDALEKEQVMNDFINDKFQILVSTTVIEVGVDVKNADWMIIYDAHRFGLNQLHQLRGRVGRHLNQGYCYLLTDNKDEETLERLYFLENCSDGFEIASKDLQLRGPGDLLGTRQSGATSFILADFVNDQNILDVALKDAKEILDNIDMYPRILKYLQNKNYSYID